MGTGGVFFGVASPIDAAPSFSLAIPSYECYSFASLLLHALVGSDCLIVAFSVLLFSLSLWFFLGQPSFLSPDKIYQVQE